MTDQTIPPKMPPEALALRAKPRRVVRFKRTLLIGVTAVGFIGIVSCAWIGLGKPQAKAAPTQAELFNPDKAASSKKPTPDALQALPASYSSGEVPQGVPVLGPPLPGDLGKPMLDHQEASALAYSTPVRPSAVPLQRQANARQSGVFFQTSARSDSAVGEMVQPAFNAAPPSTTAPSALTLELDKDQNAQARKLEFASSNGLRSAIYNSHAIETPQSPYEVLAGSIIPASMVTGLNSDLPGMVIAQVTENVYDTVTGHILLIPQGTRLIGQYDSVVAFGQSRALLVWQRMILPDGTSLQIDNMPATDASGYTGLSDKVDYHTWSMLKGIGMATVIGLTAYSGDNHDSDLVRAIRESAGQGANQASQRIVEKQLNLQTSLTVRPGWPVRVVVHKDLILQPYAS